MEFPERTEREWTKQTQRQREKKNKKKKKLEILQKPVRYQIEYSRIDVIIWDYQS